LLQPLADDEIADLFAYLQSPVQVGDSVIELNGQTRFLTVHSTVPLIGSSVSTFAFRPMGERIDAWSIGFVREWDSTRRGKPTLTVDVLTATDVRALRVSMPTTLKRVSPMRWSGMSQVLPIRTAANTAPFSNPDPVCAADPVLYRSLSGGIEAISPVVSLRITTGYT